MLENLRITALIKKPPERLGLKWCTVGLCLSVARWFSKRAPHAQSSFPWTAAGMSSVSSPAVCASAALLVFFILPLTARAVPRTWENTGTTFGTGGNWIGGTAPANSLTADIGVFANPVVTNNPNVTADRSINGLLFNAGTAGWTMSGGNGDTLRLGSSGIVNDSTNTQTFNTSLGTFNLALGANASFAANSGGFLMNLPIDLNTFTLTVNDLRQSRRLGIA